MQGCIFLPVVNLILKHAVANEWNVKILWRLCAVSEVTKVTAYVVVMEAMLYKILYNKCADNNIFGVLSLTSTFKSLDTNRTWRYGIFITQNSKPLTWFRLCRARVIETELGTISKGKVTNCNVLPPRPLRYYKVERIH